VGQFPEVVDLRLDSAALLNGVLAAFEESGSSNMTAPEGHLIGASRKVAFCRVMQQMVVSRFAILANAHPRIGPECTKKAELRDSRVLNQYTFGSFLDANLLAVIGGRVAVHTARRLIAEVASRGSL
jgi:hypothetical protein